MNSRAVARHVVKVVSAGDRDWLARDRHHFLSRAAFDQYRQRSRGPQSVHLVTVSPFLDLAAALFFLFLPFWALWWATKTLCPPAAGLSVWFGRGLARLGRSLLRWAHHILWRRPRERLGLAVTVWLWLAGAWLVLIITSALNGHLVGIASAVPLLFLIVVLWHVLRWWRERAFRPRPLPRRQVRVRHD